MPRDDTRIWALFDRAATHLIMARFGRHSEAACGNLYRRAAGFLMEAARLLLEEGPAAEPMGEAERMVKREQWPAL